MGMFRFRVTENPQNRYTFLVWYYAKGLFMNDDPQAEIVGTVEYPYKSCDTWEAADYILEEIIDETRCYSCDEDDEELEDLEKVLYSFFHGNECVKCDTSKRRKKIGNKLPPKNNSFIGYRDELKMFFDKFGRMLTKDCWTARA